MNIVLLFNKGFNLKPSYLSIHTGLFGYVYVSVRVSQTGLGRSDRSVDQPRPACLGMYACMRVSQTGLLGCVRIRACVSDRARPACLLVLAGKL